MHFRDIHFKELLRGDYFRPPPAPAFRKDWGNDYFFLAKDYQENTYPGSFFNKEPEI